MVIGDVIEFVVVVKVEVEVRGPVGPTGGSTSTVLGGSFSDPVGGWLGVLPLCSRLTCHRGFSFIGRSVRFTIVSWVFVRILVGMMVGLMGSW